MKFLVEIKMPRYKNAHFESLIPDQQRQIAELIVSGTVVMFSLNLERTKSWMVVEAATAEAVQAMVETFCLYRYMRVSIEPLMLYDNAAHRLPPIVLN